MSNENNSIWIEEVTFGNGLSVGVSSKTTLIKLAPAKVGRRTAYFYKDEIQQIVDLVESGQIQSYLDKVDEITHTKETVYLESSKAKTQMRNKAKAAEALTKLSKEEIAELLKGMAS